MQSNNASKKTRKTANDPAVGAIEVADSSQLAISSRTARSSKAKKTETTDLGPAKHRNSPVEIADKTPARSMAAGAATNGASTNITRPSAEDIARLAYSLWEARGFRHGSAEDDWLKAEQELLAKR